MSPSGDTTLTGVWTPDSLHAAALAALPNAAIFAVDLDLRLILAEGEALAAHGYDSSVLRGRLLEEVIHSPEAFAELEPEYRAAFEGQTRSLEHGSSDGTKWYWTRIAPLTEGDRVVGAVAVSQDVTARHRADEELRDVTTQFETAFAAAPIGMTLVALDGSFLRCNRALCDLLGYTEDELMALTFQDITHPDDLDSDLGHVKRLLSGDASSYTMEKRYVTSAGKLVWVLLAAALVRHDDGSPSHFISQIKDITATRRMEERLRQLADHDPVTDLLNRRRFEDELGRQVGRCQRYGETASLLILDVDDFKAINDVFGHRVGDAALQQVALTLNDRLRATDVVARIGGDEFAALLPGVTAESARSLAEEVRAAVEGLELRSGGRAVVLTASIGLMTLDEDTADEDAAFVAADRAMYDAKAGGRNRVSVAQS